MIKEKFSFGIGLVSPPGTNCVGLGLDEFGAGPECVSLETD